MNPKELIQNHLIRQVYLSNVEIAEIFLPRFDNPERLAVCDSNWVEVLEVWLVSNWIYNKLSCQDESVAIWKGLPLWGRTSTGFAIEREEVTLANCQTLTLYFNTSPNPQNGLGAFSMLDR